MTAHISPAEARSLGLLGKAPANTPRNIPAKKRTTRKAEPRAGAVSECHVCHERFSTDAAETRHIEQYRHARISSLFTTADS
jgi:hypothetical protein